MKSWLPNPPAISMESLVLCVLFIRFGSDIFPQEYDLRQVAILSFNLFEGREVS
jgi:hypothetical protein